MAHDAPTRIDRWIVAALVLVVLGAVVLHDAPRIGGDTLEPPPARGSGRLASLAKLAAPPMFDAVVLEAPPLREPEPLSRVGSTASRTDPNRIGRSNRAASPATLDAVTRHTASASAGHNTASREPPREGRGGDSTLPAQRGGATAAVPGEHWHSLDDALARCGGVGGAIARAFCEQEARLLHCDGFWGLVAYCPVPRSEYGQ